MEPKVTRCPYCGEEIMEVAKKCRHCGEWLNTERIKPGENATGNNMSKRVDNILLTNATASSAVPFPNLNTKQYFISVNDQQRGPFTLEDLHNQQITPDTWVWDQGKNEWVPASQISELQSLFSSQPQYQQAVNPNNMPEQEIARCPYCDEEISANAKKCMHCGEWLDEDNHETKRKTPEALLGDGNAVFLGSQAAIAAFIIGIALQSWSIGIFAFIGLIILLAIPYAEIAVCVLLSLCYAYIGYIIGDLFSTKAGWITAIVVGLLSLCVNLGSKDASMDSFIDS